MGFIPFGCGCCWQHFTAQSVKPHSSRVRLQAPGRLKNSSVATGELSDDGDLTVSNKDQVHSLSLNLVSIVIAAAGIGGSFQIVANGWL